MFNKNTSGGRRNKKRSKNQRFMSNAKGFAKQGIYGRGAEIKDDQFHYFIKILDTMKEGFESTEDKVTMANNVLNENVGEEVHLSSNQVVSKAIEALIGFTSEGIFERFQQSFSENIRPICSHKFASHVLQKIIEIAFLRSVEKPDSSDSEPAKKKSKKDVMEEKAYNTTTEFSENHKKCCSNFVLKTGKYLLNNMEEFLWDPYASHILKTNILCLGGIFPNKVAFKHVHNNKASEEVFSVPEEWKSVIEEFGNRLQLWPQLPDFPYQNSSSVVIGALCQALKIVNEDLLVDVGNKILSKAFLKPAETSGTNENDAEEKNDSCNDLPLVFKDPSAVRLLETLLAAANLKLFKKLYKKLFTGHLKTIALDFQSNFAVQRLFMNVMDTSIFESSFDEISDDLEDIIRAGHTGIPMTISDACLRLGAKQGAFVKAMQKALHCADSKEKLEKFFPCLLKLKPYEIIMDDKTQFIHMNGALIIENILRFNKPIMLVKCILDMDPDSLVAVFSSPNGSYIADTFLTSEFIGEKSREKLIRHLQEHYTEMAITKFGSRVLERIFDIATDPQKLTIAKELVDKVNQLNGTMFGRVLYTNFRLKTFKLSPSQWLAGLKKSTKVEKMFEDILSK